ncbi:MAG: hypothetical protein AAFP82_00385 [Bacteroidota bacterium]
MKKSILIIPLLLVLSFVQTKAQRQAEMPKNSIEFNLIWPLVPKIYQLKYARQFELGKSGRKGEFVSSINYRLWAFAESEGDKTMFAIAIGYRHFWWKGLNSELAIYPEFVRIRNSVVDNNSYRDFYIVPEFYSGYKGFLGNKGLFYNVQLGTGIIIFPDESYPRLEDTGVFFNGNLTIGYTF